MLLLQTHEIHHEWRENEKQLKFTDTRVDEQVGCKRACIVCVLSCDLHLHNVETEGSRHRTIPDNLQTADSRPCGQAGGQSEGQTGGQAGVLW